MVVNEMQWRTIGAIRPCMRQSNATKSWRLTSDGSPKIADFALVAAVQFPRSKAVIQWFAGARTMEVTSNLVVGVNLIGVPPGSTRCALNDKHHKQMLASCHVYGVVMHFIHSQAAVSVGRSASPARVFDASTALRMTSVATASQSWLISTKQTTSLRLCLKVTSAALGFHEELVSRWSAVVTSCHKASQGHWPMV